MRRFYNYTVGGATNIKFGRREIRTSTKFEPFSRFNNFQLDDHFSRDRAANNARYPINRRAGGRREQLPPAPETGESMLIASSGQNNFQLKISTTRSVNR